MPRPIRPATAPAPNDHTNHTSSHVDTGGRLVLFGGSGAARAAMLTAEMDASRGHTAHMQHVFSSSHFPLQPRPQPGQAWQPEDGG